MTIKLTPEDLAIAALIFERANGISLAAVENHQIEISELSLRDTKGIEEEVLETLEEKPLPSLEFRSLAYWALGKRIRTRLLPRFQVWLKREIEENNPDLIYQLLIALDSLDEGVFGSDRLGCVSIHENEINLRDAHAYLNISA